MTTRETHDPHGRVQCDDCDAIGRPHGGVTTLHAGARVHISFTLPAGWALRDGALLCSECARLGAAS